MSEKLILNEQALEKMGIVSETIYTLEFDMNAELKIPKSATKEEKEYIKRQNKLSRKFRNKMMHLLKFKLYATRHLESSWILEGKYLESAVRELEQLRNEMKARGFKDADKRIKIIPILTTVSGFQTYEDKKAEFLLDFLMEHIKYCEKGIKEQRMSEPILWRCKQAVSIVMAHSEALKNHKRYNEIMDTISILDEQIGECGKIILETKREKQKEKDKEDDKK